MNIRKDRYSTDPIVHLIDIQEFYENCDYLKNIERHLWDNNKPEEDANYIKITKDKLVIIYYGWKFTNFGNDFAEKLVRIEVANRDGHTEFEILESRLNQLIEKAKNNRPTKHLLNEIAELKQSIEWAERNFPKYKAHSEPKKKMLEDYLVYTGKTFDTSKYKNVVVLDVETNGIRKAKDDLLSISIYSPKTGVCYNRFLPLDQQPVVLTTFVNGITEETLENERHFDQAEINELIKYFDLQNAYILSYSGGQGRFDKDFVVNYCKRHNLTGFEELKYVNIKSFIPRSSYGTEGQLTKDNLCKLLGICDVSNIHTSLNDCILEWQIFQKIIEEKLFFINEHIYSFNEDYVIPVSLLIHNPELVKFAHLDLKPIIGETTKIFEYELPKKALKQVKKFSTNITGVSLENSINSLLNVEKQDNSHFLIENKKKLKYIASLESRFISIPTVLNDDGTISTTAIEHKEYIEEVNATSNVISQNIKPVINYIKDNIFKTDKILSQEMVISDNNKVLALCDLSDSENVLEIKTMEVVDNDGNLFPDIAKQLYFQQKHRQLYVLSIDFDVEYLPDWKQLVKGIIFSIYKVDLKEKELPPEIVESKYMDSELAVFDCIYNDCNIVQKEICRITGLNAAKVSRVIRKLKHYGVIERDGSNKGGSWKILKVIKKGDTYSYEISPSNSWE